ncbi:MAG: hypothetical protein ACN6QE_04685 [Pseudomonas putida]
MSEAKKVDSKAKAQIADLYIGVIKGLGFDPKVDSDGDVTFLNKEGLHVIAIIDADHKQFVRLTIPGIYDVNDASRLEILESCNYSNRLSKGAKVYTPKSSKFVWVAYEVVLEELDAKSLEYTIDAGVHLMVAASARFLKNIKDAK